MILSTRLRMIVLLFLALAGMHQSLLAETPRFSVMEVPAVEGSDGPQVAVKWSGALPASLQPGYEDEHGHFVAEGSAMRLEQSMNLLPLPPVPEQGTRVWQVLGSDGRVLAQQRSGSASPGWQPGYFLSPGVDSTVRAVVEFEGDLIVAGDFLTVGDQMVNRIARWDGTAWSALSGPSGTGVNGTVRALAVYNDELIAGGGFSTAGGIGSSGVARWDGSQWVALNGLSSTFGLSVNALAIYNGELIVGGRFGEADGLTVNRIARWDGSQWAELSGPSGTGVNEDIWALTVYDNELVAGGRFTNAGGLSVNKIARWNGSGWASLDGPSGTGVNADVYALTVYSAELIAGGAFSTAGGLMVNQIARWNGSNWASLDGTGGTGVDNQAVRALSVYDGALIAGGAFTQAGGVTVNRIARWDGTDWAALSGPSGTGVDNGVETLIVHDGALIAGGLFTQAGGVTVNRIARWDGSAWSALSGPSGAWVNNWVRALTVYDGALIAGGDFTEAGGVIVNSIARWDGISWTALSGPYSTGVNNRVLALTVHDGKLIVGGDFTEAGGVTVNRVARWDGMVWSAVSGPSGTGVNGRVLALTVQDGSLIAGGDFTEAGGVTVNRVARWDGIVWSSLSGPSGTGVDNTVVDLIVYDGALVAGGVFTEAGGVTVNHIARWDGASWSALSGPLGTGVNNSVLDLTLHNGYLIAGGNFTEAGGVEVNHIARWNSTTWSALSGPSDTGTNNRVRALTVHDTDLVASGDFTQAGGVTVNRVARWDGTNWSALSGPAGTGVNNWVFALTVYDGNLIAGGDFTQAGGIASVNIGEYRTGYTIGGTVSGLTGSGLVLQNNGGDDLPLNTDGSFSFGTAVTSGSGYDVTVLSQPTAPDQICEVVNATGVVSDMNVTDVEINCINTYTIGGNVSGLAGSGLVLQNNGEDDLAVLADGPLTFGTALTSGSGYAVTVLTQPTAPDQICDMMDATGTVSGMDVTDVAVNCTTLYTVGGTVSGLAGSGLVLQNNAGDDLAIGSNGSFEFDTALLDGTDYEATVLTQPGDPSQTCTVVNSSGTLAGADISNIEVTCTTNSYTVTTTAANGTITSIIDPVVEWGQTTTVTGQADANHYFASVDGCNGIGQSNSDQSIADFSYETGAIEADCTVSAEFSVLTYSISSAVSSGQGTIDVLTPIVDHGGDAGFEVTPDTGWSLQSFSGNTCTPFDNGDGTWTATMISADCEVTAEFIEDTTTDLDTSLSPAIVGMPVTYTITVTGTDSAPADGQVELASDLDGVICSLPGADLMDGQAAVFICEHTWNTAGVHQLTATFSESEFHEDGGDVLVQTIVPSETVFSDQFETDP